MFGLRFNLFKLKLTASPSRQFKAALRTRLQAAAAEQFNESSFASWTRPTWQRALAPISVALIALFSVSSYAYASPAVGEDSLLYPVKTNLERAESLFHRSPEAKAKFAARLVARRFAEATYGIDQLESSVIQGTDTPVYTNHNQIMLTSTSSDIDSGAQVNDQTTVVSSTPDKVKEAAVAKLDSIIAKIESLPIDESEKVKLLDKVKARQAQIKAGIRPSQKILEFKPRNR